VSSQNLRCPKCSYSARIRLKMGKNELRCPECRHEFTVWN
jgi:DNA-directed RNA polymerase subunit RPC12/RpoP